MTSEPIEVPAYSATMRRLEGVKRVSSEGVEFWMARDMVPIMGYASLDNLSPVIERAADSLKASGHDSSHHIVRTQVMMGVGKGAQREATDYFLSRAACYLIAMNGDPGKPQVAAAQAYFATQTRSAEIAQKNQEDRKRLALRERVTMAVKRVGEVAKNAGVERYALFHNARYQGLYGADKRAVDRAKGLRDGENLFDRAGALELSAHDFQMQLAATKIVNESINGEQNAIAANLQVAQQVRKTVIDQAGIAPEALPLESEPIKEVKKRLSKQAQLPRPR